MMQDNQLQINSTGLRLKTSEDKILAWRSCLTNVLTTYRYTLLQSIPLTDSYHQSFEKGDEALIVNWFKDGQVQLSTNYVDQLFDYIIPHFEIKLDVKFHCEPEEFDLYPSYMVYYLTNRDDKRRAEAAEVERKRSAEVAEVNRKRSVVEFAEITRRKSVGVPEMEKIDIEIAEMERTRRAEVADADRKRRAEIAEAAKKRSAEIIEDARQKSQLSELDEYACEIGRPPFLVDTLDSPYVRMQDELSDARTKLATTENRLEAINRKLTRESVNDHYQCKGYQRCCFETFCPLFNHNYKYGYKYGYPGYTSKWNDGQ